MSYEKAEMKTYRIVTDAVSVDIEAMDEDDAAIKFARKNSSIYGGCRCVADLIFRAKQMGGNVNVEEV